MRRKTEDPMTKRHTTIVSALLAVVLLTVAGCGGHKHQTGNPTSTTSAPATTADSPTTSATPTSAPSGNTTTTVLGPSGPASSYPAAQATPPSLAGAYPNGITVNPVEVLKTLTTYEDWVWSHPNPALVANYELQAGNAYANEVSTLTEFAQRGLHAATTPAEIDFVKVDTPGTVDSPPHELGRYEAFRGPVITAVYNTKAIPLLTATGHASGQQFNPPTIGPTAFLISLVQGPDGRFRFATVEMTNPPGGIAALESGS
jgi:hypothetical protein